VPDCHQCKIDVGGSGRSGDCKVCYSKGVDFCQRCAMWELGPLPADVDLAAAIRKADDEAEVEREDRDQPEDALNKIGDEPLACDVFLPTMGEVCPFFKDQLTNVKATLYGEQFKVYVCKVLDKFQDLYKTCKYDRLAIQVLIASHLSAQERVQCRDKKDASGESTSAAARPLKRWQTRSVARAHLTAHLDEVQTKFGKPIRDAVARPAWLLALGCDDLELFFKGFKHPTLAAIDLLAAAGGAPEAQEALEIFTIVHHALTATRARAVVKEHWSAKNVNFTAKEALGFLSEEYFVHLYGDVAVGKAFSDAAEAQLECLWNVLGDDDPKNALPAHPRYADIAVSGNGLLDGTEKAYLQYLPTFDHPEAQAGARTACETAVRTRVLATLKAYLADYAPVEWYKPPTLVLSWTDTPAIKGRTKTLTIKEPRRLAIPAVDLVFGPDGTHASVALAALQKNKIAPFIRSLLTPSDLRANGYRVEIEITGESGNTRRGTRRTVVEAAVREAFDAEKQAFSWQPAFVDAHGAFDPGAPMPAFLDGLCARLAADFCVDQAFDAGVSKMIINNALANGIFTPKAWFPLKTKDVDYAVLFPDCPFDAETIDTIDEHYEDIQGSSPRPAHYMDWRNHKDIWLYDCFAIEHRRRPIFGSLSMQPYLPAPNSNYGGHILFYKRAPIAGRAVYTFGDKQQPRRSMLLVLDTILHGRTKKDGATSQKPDARQKVLFQLLRRNDTIVHHADWDNARLWAKTFDGKKVPYPDGDSLIECQVFGGIVLTTDAWGFVPACEDKDSLYYVAKDHIKDQDLAAARLQLQTVYPNITVFPYTYSKVAVLPSDTSGKDAWKAHLSEIAE
jgi:hypothetical protein